jgi:hypothetical protein
MLAYVKICTYNIYTYIYIYIHIYTYIEHSIYTRMQCPMTCLIYTIHIYRVPPESCSCIWAQRFSWPAPVLLMFYQCPAVLRLMIHQYQKRVCVRVCERACVCLYSYMYTHTHTYTHTVYECVCTAVNSYRIAANVAACCSTQICPLYTCVCACMTSRDSGRKGK